MNKALLLFLVPGIMAFAPVTEESEEDGNAEVDQALQPFWDLLLAKVTVFSETWSQRIKEVMRSLSYPKGHHYKCPEHHLAQKTVDEAKVEDPSLAIQDVLKQDVMKQDFMKQDVIKQDVMKQDVMKQDVTKQGFMKQDVFLEQPERSVEQPENSQE